MGEELLYSHFSGEKDGKGEKTLYNTGPSVVKLLNMINVQKHNLTQVMYRTSKL